MTRGRWAVGAGALLLALLAVAVVLGRHERGHADAVQRARIEAVRAAVGPRLDGPDLTAYRLEPGFACLLYRSGASYYALKLCFDPLGRLVESLDRRGGGFVYGSVTYRPALAPETVPKERILAILRARGVPAREIAASGY